jgi:uncharacterized OB-fold protein
MTTQPTAPTTDPDSRQFWDGLASHRVVLQQCDSCREVRFPALPACRSCGSTEWHSVDLAGTGTIYSWIVVHRPFSPAFTTQVPYTIATIDLDEGPRMIGRLEGGIPEFGAVVKPPFHDHETWTELRFAVAPVERKE